MLSPGFKTARYVMYPGKALFDKKRRGRLAGDTVVAIYDQRGFLFSIFKKWFYRCLIQLNRTGYVRFRKRTAISDVNHTGRFCLDQRVCLGW